VEPCPYRGADPGIDRDTCATHTVRNWPPGTGVKRKPVAGVEWESVTKIAFGLITVDGSEDVDIDRVADGDVPSQ
jgi:hypothetical protein